MHRDSLAAQRRFFDSDLHFRVGHPRGLRVGVRHQVVARQIELDRVDTVLQEHPAHAPHVFRPADVDCEAEFGEG